MEIRQYLNTFRRWAWLIVLVTVLGVLAGYIISRYQKPVYNSQTKILVMQNKSDSSVSDTLLANNQQLAQTYSQLIGTYPVISATSQRLGYPVSPKQIQVSQIPDADIITIGVEDGDPQRAADIANNLVVVFVEQNKALQASRFTSSEESLQAQIQDVDAKIANLQTQLAQQSEDIYKQQVDEVSRTIANLQNEINTLQQDVVQLDYAVNPPAMRIPGRYYTGPTPSVDQQLELTQKQDRLSELRNLLGMYQRIYVDLTYNPNNNGANQGRNLDQIQTTLTQYQQIYSNLVANLESIRLARLRSTPNIVQIEQALPARVPTRPNPLMNMAIGGILGLLLSGGFGFLSEYMDDTLRSPEEVSEILHLPVLGYIGDMDARKLKAGKTANLPYVLAQPRSPVTEAFRSLRANIEFVDLDRPVQTLAVTSSSVSEGKTTIATNLAIVMAQLGRKVVLIDADLRRPRVHRALGISNVMGLSDVLRNHASIQEVAQPWGNGNLMVITSGSLPPNPAEVLSSDRMLQVMSELKNIADMVVIDSPPSLLADSAILAARADGVLLVIQSNKTQLNSATAMIEQLKRVGAHVIGVALNRMNTRDPYYYYGDLKHYTSYAYDVEKTQPGVKQKL